jgi:hypothetical protein
VLINQTHFLGVFPVAMPQIQFVSGQEHIWRRVSGDEMNPIGEWAQKGQLRSWFERTEVVFLDEEIDESSDAKRALKVLKWIGEVGYEKLKRLCAPKLSREEMKYAELKNCY